jgi:iron(III) transport system permease protein
MPLAVPPTFLGIGMIHIWNRPSTSFIHPSVFILVFTYIARFIPYSVRTISSNLKQVNINMDEAALLTGAGCFKRIFRISLPLLRPGILAGWAFFFHGGTGSGVAGHARRL